MTNDLWYILAFYGISAILVLASLMVVLRSSIIHSALLLVLAFGMTAGVFILLHAEFVAAVQVLVYVGAVAILLIFAIMMTQKAYMSESNSSNRQWLWAAIVSLAFMACGILVFLTTPWKIGGDMVKIPDTTVKIGELLFVQYALPFEIASVLLLAATIGAIVVARED
jgi:NADH:ubiquinone oxidoreductase subunit 6 (subunit J)